MSQHKKHKEVHDIFVDAVFTEDVPTTTHTMGNIAAENMATYNMSDDLLFMVQAYDSVEIKLKELGAILESLERTWGSFVNLYHIIGDSNVYKRIKDIDEGNSFYYFVRHFTMGIHRVSADGVATKYGDLRACTIPIIDYHKSLLIHPSDSFYDSSPHRSRLTIYYRGATEASISLSKAIECLAPKIFYSKTFPNIRDPVPLRNLDMIFSILYEIVDSDKLYDLGNIHDFMLEYETHLLGGERGVLYIHSKLSNAIKLSDELGSIFLRTLNHNNAI